METEFFKWPQISKISPVLSRHFYYNKTPEGKTSTGYISRNLSKDLSWYIILAGALTRVLFGFLLFFEMDQPLPQETAQNNL